MTSRITAAGIAAQVAGELFNARIYDPAGIVNTGLFRDGQGGPISVQASGFSYNQSNLVSLVVDPSDATYDYAVDCDDPSSTVTWVQGLAGSGSSYDATILAESGLLSYWDLDDTAAPAVDSKNAKNASVSGTGVTFLAAPATTQLAGNAVQMNGSGYLAPSAQAAVSTDKMTFECWSYITGYPGFSNNCVLYGGRSNLRCISQNSGGRFYFGIWFGGTEWVLQDPVPAGFNPVNQPVHWVFKRDGIHAEVWGNNQLLGSAADVPAGNQDSLTGFLGATDSGTPEFIGRLDNCALYNVALTSTQIGAHYAAGTSGAGSLGGPLALSCADVGGLSTGQLFNARLLVRRHGYTGPGADSGVAQSFQYATTPAVTRELVGAVHI